MFDWIQETRSNMLTLPPKLWLGILMHVTYVCMCSRACTQNTPSHTHKHAYINSPSCVAFYFTQVCSLTLPQVSEFFLNAYFCVIVTFLQFITGNSE